MNTGKYPVTRPGGVTDTIQEIRSVRGSVEDPGIGYRSRIFEITGVTDESGLFSIHCGK
jgi:hypothetical protein